MWAWWNDCLCSSSIESLQDLGLQEILVNISHKATPYDNKLAAEDKYINDYRTTANNPDNYSHFVWCYICLYAWKHKQISAWRTVTLTCFGKNPAYVSGVIRNANLSDFNLRAFNSDRTQQSTLLEINPRSTLWAAFSGIPRRWCPTKSWDPGGGYIFFLIWLIVANDDCCVP